MTSARLDHIPGPLLDEARSAGLDAAAIALRWAKYTDWHARSYGEDDFRMTDWRRHIEWELEATRKVITMPLSAEERSGLRQLRQRELEQAIADELYDREKVTFGDWIRGLEARERGFGAPLAPHEQALLDWRRNELAEPRGRPVWGMEALMAFGADVVCRCHGGELACERDGRAREKRDSILGQAGGFR